MVTVTTNDIMVAGGLTPRVLSGMVSSGTVVPEVRSGGGRGNVHKFRLMQAVGLAVAGRLMGSARGCHVRHAAKIVAAFEAVTTEDWLQDQFAEGRTHYVMIHKGRPLLDGGKYDWPDVKAIYEQLLAAGQGD